MSLATSKDGIETTKKMERRAFLKLSGNASIFMVAAGMGVSVPIVTKYAAIDLDWAGSHMRELQHHFNQGNARYVLKEAARCYAELKQAKLPRNVPRAAEIQMRFGMLLASAQESVLPWVERTLPAMNTYNAIEKDVLSKLPLRRSSSYFPYLLARQAPLYRERGDLGRSLELFTSAIEACGHELEDVGLLVELYYSRAHVRAVLGDERSWRLDFDRAKQYAHQSNAARSKELLALITYTEGEGYKRLAYNQRLDLSEDRRIWYATRGLQCFELSHLEESRWVGHALLQQLAAAQCMIFIDPNEAICQAQHLRIEAQRVYPSMVQKIESTLALAQRRLQGPRRR